MNSFDFDTLRVQIREAARLAFGALRAQHPDETFYAMALYTDDGAMTVCTSANSEEAFQRILLGDDFSDPASVAATRWFTAEWAYESVHSEHFDVPCERLRKHVLTLDDDAPAADAKSFAAPARRLLAHVLKLGKNDSFGVFRSKLHDTMVQALAELDQEGFFGTGSQRQALTLFCSISDSDEAEAFEDRSAKQLNPPAVFAAFEKRWDVSSA